MGVLLLGSAGIIFGQQPSTWQPEVRRALPAEEQAPTPAPPRAIPVARPWRLHVPRRRGRSHTKSWMERVQPPPRPSPTLRKRSSSPSSSPASDVSSASSSSASDPRPHSSPEATPRRKPSCGGTYRLPAARPHRGSQQSAASRNHTSSQPSPELENGDIR